MVSNHSMEKAYGSQVVLAPLVRGQLSEHSLTLCSLDFN